MNLAITTVIHNHHSVGRWLRSKSSFNTRQNGPVTETQPSVQAIARHKILEIKQAMGVTIECLEGSVWVTQDGDMRDVILDAGQALNVDRKQRTLIQALDTARVRLSHAPCAL